MFADGRFLCYNQKIYGFWSDGVIKKLSKLLGSQNETVSNSNIFPSLTGLDWVSHLQLNLKKNIFRQKVQTLFVVS